MYNVKEDDSLEFSYLNDFTEICKRYGIQVEIEFKGGENYFNQFVGTTIVFRDEYDGEEFDFENGAFLDKLLAIQEFFTVKVFDVKTSVNLLKLLIDFLEVL